MTLEIGETYDSPVHGRRITVLAIDKETSESFKLAILWVDKQTGETEPGDLEVSKVDLQRWKKVDY